MDADGSSSSKKTKRKFAPRAPPSRRPTAPPPPTDGDAEERTAQMIASNYGIGRVKPKAAKKASAEVAFQPTSASLPNAPVAVLKDDGKSCDSDPKSSLTADALATATSATAQKDGEETQALTLDDDNALAPKAQKDYVEPWDHRNSYDPITLPWRKPPSGDPELRDREEFGEVARYPDFDESTINSAKELGLTLEDRDEQKQKMLFFQIPGPLPVKTQLTDVNNEDSSERRSAFDGLQRGFMGKMRVYKSGAVKWKLGDIEYDVSPGIHYEFFNQVAAINVRKQECCELGSMEQMATVSPNIESLLNSLKQT